MNRQPDAKPKASTLWLAVSGGYLLLLWLVALSVGVLLMAYDVSPLVWAIILAVAAHLAWTGTAAIALAMAGLLSLMWGATVGHALPKTVVVHEVIAQIWAMSLLGLWCRGGLFVLMLGFAHRALKPWSLVGHRSGWFLLGLICSGLGVGVRVYAAIPKP